MNKVEIKGTVCSFGMSSAEIEICMKTPEGFHRVTAEMNRETAQGLSYGKEIYVRGKLMKKDGTIETENVKFPNWRMVIPDPKKTEMVAVRLDFAGIRQFEADFKAKKKLDKRMEGYVRVGGCLFKLDYLIKAVRFMEHVGTDELMVNPDGRRAALAVSGDSKMILCPVYPRDKFEDYEVCYGL